MLKELASIASSLDSKGFFKEADKLDMLIARMLSSTHIKTSVNRSLMHYDSKYSFVKREIAEADKRLFDRKVKEYINGGPEVHITYNDIYEELGGDKYLKRVNRRKK